MGKHRPTTKAKFKMRPIKPIKPINTAVLLKMRSSLAHEPSEESRSNVETMAAMGLTQPQMAGLIGIADTTLRIYYREELDRGLAIANLQVAQTLFQQALKGDTTSMIFWLKTRAGWRETSRLEVVRPEDQPKLIEEGMTLQEKAAAYEATLRFPYAITLQATEEEPTEA